MKVHVVDGTYELFRHYYARIPPRVSPDGADVTAVWGVMQSMLGMLREPGVTHIAAATDHVIESFRNDLFAGYKTGDGLPEDLWTQFPLVEDALRALGIVVWPMVEHEADDALATAAAHLGSDARVEQVVICSPDKDLAQCVRGTRVVCLDRRQRLLLDEGGVVEKFGVPPCAIPDFLALVGDAADGIPGIPGFGAKTAAVLLARYGSLDAIPADAETWDVRVRGASGLARTLAGQAAEARLYKILATLRTDAPIACGLDDIAWHGVPRSDLEALCLRLGFEDLLARVPAVAGHSAHA